MPHTQLFGWWISSITFNIVFVIAASIYLYVRRTTPKKEMLRGVRKLTQLVKDFVFVWVLLGLLVFYIYTVGVESYTIFAAGNIVVEILLAVYVIKVGKALDAQ